MAHRFERALSIPGRVAMTWRGQVVARPDERGLGREPCTHRGVPGIDARIKALVNHVGGGWSGDFFGGAGERQQEYEATRAPFLLSVFIRDNLGALSHDLHLPLEPELERKLS